MVRLKENIHFCSFNGSLAGYGGTLRTYGYGNTEALEDFEIFERLVSDAIVNKRFLPIYRMADGEFQFLFGKRLKSGRVKISDLLNTILQRLYLKSQKTSWGEAFTVEEKRALRRKYIEDLRFIASNGLLGVFWNENALDAHTEYNSLVEKRLPKILDIDLRRSYVPFHFPVAFIMKNTHIWCKGKSVLIVSSLSEENKVLVKSVLEANGVKSVKYLGISKSKAMLDRLDIAEINDSIIDVVLVSAGIGSANILPQLVSFSAPAIDIGGFINCIIDHDRTEHGGMFKWIGIDV